MSADTNGKTGMREMFLRTIAVIGLLAVLILGAWGIIVLATSIPHLFENTGQSISDSLSDDDEDNNPQTSVVVSNSNPSTTVVPPTNVTKPKPVVTAPKPTYTTPSSNYVPATTRSALYGQPDLVATVQNVYPISGGRTGVQFTVQNMGSNVASAGWSFNAQIPWERSSYTYAGPAQQALYPGDKIVYVLGFDSVSNSRSNDNRYDECDTNGYRSWDEDDWQEWYDDNDCGDEFDCENISRSEWSDWSDSEWENWYEDECDEDEYYDNYDRNDSRSTNSGTITIVADPSNRVYESNESNNSVSVRQ